MILEEVQMVDAPVSDFSAGVATGIGIGLGILGLMVVSGC
jgi:hypothetical protein